MSVEGNFLSSILDPLRLENAFVSQWKTNADWAFLGPSESCALLHFVSAGRVFLGMDNDDLVTLEAGDLAIFPHGHGHWIGSSTTAMSSPLEDVLPARPKGELVKVEISGVGPRTALLCAGLHYECTPAALLHQLLPEMIVFRRKQLIQEPLLWNIIQGLLLQLERPQAERSLALRRGLELAYLLSLRVALQLEDSSGANHRMLQDPRIRKALVHMHGSYAQRAKVAELASVAGMSRSAFSHAFRTAVGHSPAQYMSVLRVREARRLLSTTRLSREEVASRVGFESAAGLYLALRSSTAGSS